MRIVRSRSAFEGGFFSYLLKDGRSRWLLVLLALGMLLLIAGFFLDGKGAGAQAPSPTKEEELARLLSSVEGVGECVVTVVYSPTNREEVIGVAVICEGGESAQTRERVITMLSTLFCIGTHRITVEKLSK